MFSFVLLAVIAWNMRRERSPEQFVTHIVLPIYVTFLLPIFCLCYASASIAGEREERTLVYSLSTPIPRPLIHLSKYLAATALVLVWAIGGLAAMSAAAGSAGSAAFQRLWLIALIATLAYCSLFHLFSVVFRRATIVALAYALAMEVLVGNMPGTVKRLTVAFTLPSSFW